MDDLVNAWKEAVEQSKRKRVDWEKYLGMPLRRFVYLMKKEGKTQPECLIEVMTKVHHFHGYVPPKLELLAMIGVSAGWSEVGTMEKVNDMEEKVENLEEVSWDEVGDDKPSTDKYFQPEAERPYRITIFSAELHRDARWKDKNGNPKLKCSILLNTVDGRPANGMIWETGSWTVMLEVKKAVQSKTLARSEFLLKKKKDGEKVSYVFENLGGKPLSTFLPDGAGAYV